MSARRAASRALSTLAPTDPNHLANKAYVDALVATRAPANYAWDVQTVLNFTPLVNGYNDLIGGVQVNNPDNTAGIALASISVRLADPGATVGGSGNLTIQWYSGTPTAAEQNLLGTTLIAAGQNNIITTFAEPIAVAHNEVIRAKVTLGSATATTQVYVQYRGRYL